MIYWHDGNEDFPHGAGPSEEGWYYYDTLGPEPIGPYRTNTDPELISKLKEELLRTGRVNTGMIEQVNDAIFDSMTEEEYKEYHRE